MTIVVIAVWQMTKSVTCHVIRNESDWQNEITTMRDLGIDPHVKLYVKKIY